MNEEPALELRNIVRRYTLPALTVLRGVDLKVAKGELVAVIGTSGAGKSTLLRLCGLIDTPNEGEVLIDGRDVGSSSDRTRSELRSTSIGFVFQDYQLLRKRTVAENVILGGYYDESRSVSELRRTASEILDVVGLHGKSDSLPPQLSGGQQQRVAIARALISEPNILLCDEPTGNLDKATASEILDFIVQLAKDTAMGALIVTHDSNVERHVDRVHTLQHGILT